MTDNELKKWNKDAEDRIIKALECCVRNEYAQECQKCPLETRPQCEEVLFKGILDLITRQKAEIEQYAKEQHDLMIEKDELFDIAKKQKAEIEQLQTLVSEMSDYFPACIGCEGKTPLGERTDKCVYEIDNTNYCTKRGITNIASIRNESRELKAEIERLKEHCSKCGEKTTKTILHLQETITEKRAEIERLENKVEELAEVLSSSIRIRYAECRAEAIKEFAERLKCLRFKGGGIDFWVVKASAIDTLVKEMVGDV